ncbi:HAD family hydrolase [Ruoffia tabacinasalis]|uniref:HAD family hydrolase n=1 Tax=Ruoffia tabacinasalis TaxID=87458 RepID=UPI002E2760F5
MFDLDGTLVDSESVYQMGWATVLKDFGHNVEVADFELMRGKGRHHNNQYIKSYLGTDILVQEARNLREEYYFNALNNNEVQLMPGALELIEEALVQGITLAVATSSYRDRGKATLDQFGLLKYFTYQVFGDEAEKMSLDLPMTQLAHKLYTQLAEIGHADEGTQAIVKLWWD